MQATLRLVDTTVGKKALVGLTGLILFGFVIAHALGNTLILIALYDHDMGRTAINEYSEMLHAIPELLWGARLTLLASVLVHIVLTMQLARQNAGARSGRYKIEPNGTDQDVFQKSARATMVYGGPFLLLYIIFHLAHLTVGVRLPIEGYEFEHLHPYENMVNSFTVPWITAIYVAATLFLGLHIYHGGQALVNTLGLRHPKWDGRTRGGAMALAALVTVVNLTIAFCASFGLLG